MKLVNKFSCNFYYFKIKKNISFITKYINTMKSINLFKTELAILWGDNSETILPYRTLREACPCAFCSGEKDVLGHQYGGQNVAVDKNISIIKYTKVGYYGLQFFFSDGHKDGIYTFDFLKTMGSN